MAINLSQFTGKFKGGARPNLFVVQIEEGPASSINEDMKILGQGASLPAATIGEIIVPYMGRQHKIPGNRTYDTWDLTIINDTDFKIRNVFHDWQEIINDPSTNYSYTASADTGGVVTAGTRYLAGDNMDVYGSFVVTQLGTDGHPLAAYTIHNAWPSVVSDIELNWESNDALETFTVTLNYSHWTQGSSDSLWSELGTAASQVFSAFQRYI
tara:strand:+ start:2200 stop:2835 length:636 start_codon:yes stop_codon:yes gene_type:complete